MTERRLTDDLELQSPDRVQFFRRPELEQGQTRFTQTAAYCVVALLRTGCQAGTWRHQHSGDGAAHSKGREQLAQLFHGMRVTRFNGFGKDEEG
jgi:hypothetical protein